MNKLTKIFTVLSLVALMSGLACGLCACSCDSEETTEESVITLPADEFDDLSEEDRLKAIKEDIDTIDELQKGGVETDEQQAAYDKAVDDLLDKAPEYKEIIDSGREDHNINTDELNEKHAEESAAYESSKAESEEAATTETAAESESATEIGTDENGNYTLPVETDENGEAEVIELPTIRIK